MRRFTKEIVKILFLLLLVSVFRTNAQTRISNAQLPNPSNTVIVVDKSKYLTIQAALNALPAGGGKVEVPSGTWPQGSTQLTIPTNYTTIECQGSGNTIITSTVASGSAILISGGHVIIRGCGFTGPGSGTADGVVFLNTASTALDEGPLLEDVYIQSFGGIGLRIDSTTGTQDYCHLNRVWSRSNGSDGIKLLGADTNACVLTDVHADLNLGWGINILTNGNTFISAESSGNGPVTPDSEDFQFSGSANFGSIYAQGLVSTGVTMTNTSFSNFLFMTSFSGVGDITDNGTNNMIERVFGTQLAISQWNISGSGALESTITGNPPQTAIVGNSNQEAQFKFMSSVTGAATPVKQFGTCNSGVNFCIFNNALSAIFTLSDSGNITTANGATLGSLGSITLSNSASNIVSVTGNGPQVTITGAGTNDAQIKLTSNAAGNSTPNKQFGTCDTGNDFCFFGNSLSTPNFVIRNGGGIASGVSANSDMDGELTNSGGTSSYTFSGTYTTHPICTANDETAIAAVKVTYTSTTSVTFTTTGSSDVISYSCGGRN